MPDREELVGLANPGPGNFVEDGAEIRDVPEGAVYVESYGPPAIVIRTALKDANGKVVNLPVLDFIEDTLKFLRETVVPGFQAEKSNVMDHYLALPEPDQAPRVLN